MESEDNLEEDNLEEDNLEEDNLEEDNLEEDNFEFVENEPSSKVLARTESESHFGIEKKSGGWFENEVERILYYAGFDTKREQRIVFEKTTNEHYRVDIIAKLNNLTLFVECKDYDEIKVSEKILFTLIGQIHDYRLENPNEFVIGIMATTAKNFGQNEGIMNKLNAENCYLWDGVMIQNLKNKQLELGDRYNFQNFILGTIEYEKETKKQQQEFPGQCVLYTRMEFYSILEFKYIGNIFSEKSIFDDLKKNTANTKIEAISMKYVKLGKDHDYRLKFVVDFRLVKSKKDIENHWKKQHGWFRKPKLPSLQLMEYDMERACRKIIENTYGIQNTYDGVYKTSCITSRSQSYL